MSKTDKSFKKVVALAYLHRYGWIVAMLLCLAFWYEHFFLILGAGCLFFSLWTFVGYKCNWKHVFCSFQNASGKKMTPDAVQWDKISKSDVRTVPTLFFVFGVLLLLVVIFW